jgi:hypothetical protein
VHPSFKRELVLGIASISQIVPSSNGALSVATPQLAAAGSHMSPTATASYAESVSDSSGVAAIIYGKKCCVQVVFETVEDPCSDGEADFRPTSQLRGLPASSRLPLKPATPHTIKVSTHDLTFSTRDDSLKTFTSAIMERFTGRAYLGCSDGSIFVVQGLT